jgi:hypothetical protein
MGAVIHMNRSNVRDHATPKADASIHGDTGLLFAQVRARPDSNKRPVQN